MPGTEVLAAGGDSGRASQADCDRSATRFPHSGAQAGRSRVISGSPTDPENGAAPADAAARRAAGWPPHATTECHHASTECRALLRYSPPDGPGNVPEIPPASGIDPHAKAGR